MFGDHRMTANGQVIFEGSGLASYLWVQAQVSCGGVVVSLLVLIPQQNKRRRGRGRMVQLEGSAHIVWESKCECEGGGEGFFPRVFPLG